MSSCPRWQRLLFHSIFLLRRNLSKNVTFERRSHTHRSLHMKYRNIMCDTRHDINTSSNGRKSIIYVKCTFTSYRMSYVSYVLYMCVCVSNNLTNERRLAYGDIHLLLCCQRTIQYLNLLLHDEDGFDMRIAEIHISIVLRATVHHWFSVNQMLCRNDNIATSVGYVLTDLGILPKMLTAV